MTISISTSDNSEIHNTASLPSNEFWASNREQVSGNNSAPSGYSHGGSSDSLSQIISTEEPHPCNLFDLPNQDFPEETNEEAVTPITPPRPIAAM